MKHKIKEILPMTKIMVLKKVCLHHQWKRSESLSLDFALPFLRFIEGREIRCAVVESVRTGQLKALSCIEYNVRQDDIRKTEDKLMLNEMGLPLGMY